MNSITNDPIPLSVATPLPRQIGSYLIECLIEKSAVHESYRGFDPHKKVSVYIKRLTSNSLHSSPQARENFSREVRLLRTINHPHITHLLQAGMEGGSPYLVCRYINGVSLREFLIHEKPRPSEAYHILRQLASALTYLHSRQIIHNDIKPENIRVSPLFHTTLIDFSIAQSLERDEDLKVHRLAGTLLYMSPEQQTQAELSAASDLYSFAIIAYELISARLSQGIIQLAHLPEPIQLIFTKALQTDPKQRYTSVEQFMIALEGVKEFVTGFYIPMRANIESHLLIDLEEQFLQPKMAQAPSSHVPILQAQGVASTAHLLFVRGSSFQGERSLIALNSDLEEPILVVVEASLHSPQWLYYLKAKLDSLKKEEWTGAQLQGVVDQTIDSFQLDPLPSVAIAELTLQPHQEGFSHTRIKLRLLSSMMGALVETGQATCYYEAADSWKAIDCSPQSHAQLFLFASQRASAASLAQLIDSICYLCPGNLTARCNLASQRLGDYLARYGKEEACYPEIKTLHTAIPILGIDLENAALFSWK